MDWKTILADKTKFGDDVKVTINGEDLTIGQLRAHDAASGGETAVKLQERENALKQREETTAAAQTRLADIMEIVAKNTGLSFDQILAGDTAAARAAAERVRTAAAASGIGLNPEGEIDWVNDPIYSPVDKRLKPVEGTLAQMQAALRAGLTVVQNDRAELAYLRFKTDNPEAAKNLKFEDALKLAVEKGYKDEVGFPNVRRALDDLAQPAITASRETQLTKEAEEKGYQKARAELLGSVGAPAGGGTAGMEFVALPEPGKGTKTPSIAEQINRAMADPEILRTTTVQ